MVSAFFIIYNIRNNYIVSHKARVKAEDGGRRVEAGRDMK